MYPARRRGAGTSPSVPAACRVGKEPRSSGGGHLGSLSRRALATAAREKRDSLSSGIVVGESCRFDSGLHPPALDLVGSWNMQHSSESLVVLLEDSPQGDVAAVVADGTSRTRSPGGTSRTSPCPCARAAPPAAREPRVRGRARGDRRAAPARLLRGARVVRARRARAVGVGDARRRRGGSADYYWLSGLPYLPPAVALAPSSRASRRSPGSRCSSAASRATCATRARRPRRAAPAKAASATGRPRPARRARAATAVVTALACADALAAAVALACGGARAWTRARRRTCASRCCRARARARRRRRSSGSRPSSPTSRCCSSARRSSSAGSPRSCSTT